MRDVQSHIQHMPITSPTFQKLQKTLARADAWRRDFQRVVSLMRSSGVENGDNDRTGHRRNVVVSGQSGFLKDLFSGSGTPHETSDDVDNRAYTQSQTVEEARALLKKGIEFSVQCEEITQLQMWVNECEEWSNSVNESLEIDHEMLRTGPLPLPAQSWNIDGLRRLERCVCRRLCFFESCFSFRDHLALCTSLL